MREKSYSYRPAVGCRRGSRDTAAATNAFHPNAVWAFAAQLFPRLLTTKNRAIFGRKSMAAAPVPPGR